MSEILYYSTNRRAQPVTFEVALLTGQAPDKGLYMPEEIPSFSLDFLWELKDKPYPEIAFNVLRLYLREVIPDEKLKELCYDAYNYDVPLERVNEQITIMRLDRGPSFSFKDFAARMMARLMQYFMENENRRLIILTATSGDTGGAVADAFYGLDNIDIYVLFPINEVSERQRRQMTTLNKNVTAIAIDGKFDDCQRMVKEAFADRELNHLPLTSANSINFGRLMPQMVYYIYAYVKLIGDIGESVIYSVPSGNFGDLMGGVFAKFMGLPVYRFIVATNENDEFPNFLKTGKYEKVDPSRKCISNAMNVGHPSNLARLIDIYGGQMDEKGNIIKMPDIEMMRKDFYSISITDEQTRETIKRVYERYGIILEPHGAVAWRAMEHYLAETGDKVHKIITLETAAPAKFPEELHALGIKPEIPQRMIEQDTAEEHFERLPADYEAFKQFLKNRYL